MAGQYENDMDASKGSSIMEENEVAAENEDERDQAKVPFFLFYLDQFIYKHLVIAIHLGVQVDDLLSSL